MVHAHPGSSSPANVARIWKKEDPETPTHTMHMGDRCGLKACFQCIPWMVGTADAHVFQIPSHLHAQQCPVNFHSQQHHQLLFPGGQPSCCWNPLCLCVAGAASAWEFLTLLGAALIQWLMRGRGVGSGAGVGINSSTPFPQVETLSEPQLPSGLPCFPLLPTFKC